MARATSATTSRRTSATSRTPAKRTSAATSSTARRTTTTTRGGSGAGGGSGTASAAREQVGAKAGQAKEQASSTLRSQLDDRSNQFGEQLTGTANDVRQIAAKLREQDNDPAARIADLAADRVEQAASYLSNNSAESLLSDVEDLARSKPWLAAGAAALVGFAASRALSSSSRKRSGGGYVNTDAGSEFDEEDAASVYPDEPGRGRS